MAISIGINGFGRTGRVALRIAINQPDTFKVCGINVRNADLGYMKYMIRYDSTFGRFQGELDTYEKDGTEYVSDGYFHESEYGSAPAFDIAIDGITSITE